MTDHLILSADPLGHVYVPERHADSLVSDCQTEVVEHEPQVQFGLRSAKVILMSLRIHRTKGL